MKNWTQDINEMHTKYGVRDAIKKLDRGSLKQFLRFRLNFLHEELNETEEASKSGHPIDPEEVVDGLIDLCVVALGTLDAFGVDAQKSWEEVHKANMSKEVGIKEGRPNPLGLPDLVKPEGWTAPCHKGNYGDLAKLA